MPVTRQNIRRGPAIVRMGGQTFYSKDDIKMVIEQETFDIRSSTAGKVGVRVKDRMAKITFTPVGAWTIAQLAILYPHGTPTIGGSLFGSADVPVKVWPIDGTESWTFTAGAITKMPSLKLAPIETAFGEVEITCLVGNGLAQSAAGSFLTYSATDAFASELDFDLEDVLTCPYAATFSGPTGWDAAIDTSKGIEVAFAMATKAVTSGNNGTVDYLLSGLDLTAKFQPLGFTAKQLVDRLAVDAVALGTDISSAAGNLTITAGDAALPKVVLNSLRLKGAPLAYSLENLRADDLEFISTRPTGAGAMFSVGMGP